MIFTHLLLPTLPCPACGVIERPRIESGRGPHVASAVCVSCGRFLKWVPRSLVEAFIAKELRMVEGINKVVLVGEVSKHGVTVRYTNAGQPCASFAIVVTRKGEGDKTYATTVNCEAWGKRAEAASEIDPGAVVAFEGELRHRQKNDQTWETIVSGFELKQILAPAQVSAGIN